MFCVLCLVFCVLCSVFCVLCSVLCALCSVLCALCSVFCVLGSVFCALCSVFCALCSVLCALCSVFDGFVSSALALHFDKNGAPGEAAPNALQQHQLPRLNTPITPRNVKRQGNARRRRVGMLINRHNYFFKRDI